MATNKQNEANRRNAQRSTGPRSDSGKARAAMNNFQHGIYAKSPIAPGEDPAQREALQAAYLARFDPPTIEQLYLVNVLSELHWEDIRLVKADAHLWTRGIKDAYKPQPDSVFGQAFQNNRETFLFLGRRRDANHRKYIATLRELESLQSVPLLDDLDDADQPQPDPAPAPAPDPPAGPQPETPAAAPSAQPEPASPAPQPAHPQPEAPAPAPQPVETAAKTSEMGSNPQTPPPAHSRLGEHSGFAEPEPRPPAPGPRPTDPERGWHPNPGHPPIDECPNCSVLGYPSPSCRYKGPKAS